MSWFISILEEFYFPIRSHISSIYIEIAYAIVKLPVNLFIFKIN